MFSLSFNINASFFLALPFSFGIFCFFFLSSHCVRALFAELDRFNSKLTICVYIYSTYILLHMSIYRQYNTSTKTYDIYIIGVRDRLQFLSIANGNGSDQAPAFIVNAYSFYLSYSHYMSLHLDFFKRTK